MLATLDFNLAKDADGNDITFKATFTNGATEYVWILVALLSLSKTCQAPQSFPM